MTVSALPILQFEVVLYDTILLRTVLCYVNARTELEAVRIARDSKTSYSIASVLELDDGQYGDGGF